MAAFKIAAQDTTVAVPRLEPAMKQRLQARWPSVCGASHSRSLRVRLHAAGETVAFAMLARLPSGPPGGIKEQSPPQAIMRCRIAAPGVQQAVRQP
jgi:hypothetical protein